MADTILALKGICKNYPGVKALQDVTFSLERGEIHALVGENGAGKSTLIKTLTGAVQPDSGEIILDGVSYSSMTPSRAIELGISVIYQEFNLLPSLTVAENEFAGQKLEGETILFNKQERVKRTKEIFDTMGVHIDVNKTVGELSVAYMQCVEIAKSLAKKTRILVMDEPTAPLSEEEVSILFKIIRKLHEQGISIIYISHRLNEIFELTQRTTIMRDGQVITTLMTSETNRDELIKYMVGREIKDAYPKRNCPIGDEILRAEHLTGNGDTDISFTLHKGEILGFGGLVGAGRTELAQMLFGVAPIESGTLYLNGKRFVPKNPQHAIRNGMGFLPEDRKRQGLSLSMGVGWNISLAILGKLSRMGVIDKAAEKKVIQEKIYDLHIKVARNEQLAGELSGGNQQKIIIGKWLAADCSVLVFDEPTRGIDVGTKYDIYKLLNALCEKGIGIIVISSDMEEIMGISDRMLILCEGKQTATITKEQFDQELILSFASGNK